jgi:hypothetical protein
MIYMIKNFLVLSPLLLSSCASISYSEFIPLIKEVTIGGEEIELSEEYIQKQPYSFLRVDLGKGANIIMVLQKVENGLYTWVSQNKEKIITYNGKIIKTEGLIHNIEILNHLQFKYFSSSNNYSGTYNTLLKNPKAFIEQKFNISLIEDGDTLLFKEKISIDPLDSEFSNFYWLDRKTGQPILSKQNIHPSLSTIRLDYIYKY